VADIVAQLQQFRREHGLSQEQVARTLGVSVVTVSRWESRHSVPSARSARRIGHFISRRHTALPRAARQLTPPPAHAAPFIGRSRELSDLLAIWPRQRLLTLTGPGGIGKSRLAAEMLRRSGQLPLAAVGLDVVPGPALTLAEIGAALGLRVSMGPGADVAITAALHDAEGVLLLDGCEHVADALRGLLRALPSRARDLRVLATSRVPLQVPGEQVVPVRGLDCPADDNPPAGRAGIASDAVQFFLSRARAHGGDGPPSTPVGLAQVGRLCRLLDGIPLAVSLVASRLGPLSLDELILYWEEHARLLADPAARYERHQVMGSAIEWSAALLSQDDRHLLGDLSVFAGPFGLGDVQVIRPDLADTTLLTAVERLVGLTWVNFVPSTDEAPYCMPRLLRDWAHRELARSGRSWSACRRHAVYVRDLGRQAEADHFRVDRGNWPGRLTRSAGDIQSALHWASGADARLGAEIATSLLGWWRTSGRITGGRHWLRACRGSADGLPALWQARAECAEALLAVDQDDYGEAERLTTSALPVLEAADDIRWLSRAMIARSAVTRSYGQTGVARQYLSRAVDYQGGQGDLHEMAWSLDSLGRLEADAGHYRRARAFYERSLTLRRELGDDRLTATTLADLAEVMTLGRSYTPARLLLNEAEILAGRVASSHTQAVVALGLGENALRSKDYQAAISRFRGARDYASAAGNGRLLALAICGLGRALCADGQESDGRNLLQVGEKLAAQLGDQMVLGKAQDALKVVTGTETTPRLTKRETDVIRLVDRGESDRAIADHLGIAVPTVRRHLENIFAKLNTRSRGSAASIWRNQP